MVKFVQHNTATWLLWLVSKAMEDIWQKCEVTY